MIFEKPPRKPAIQDVREIRDFKSFDPDQLETNEIKNCDLGTLAKIPKVPNRIALKNVNHNLMIQFIHDKVYDPETKQNRIRKTTIGVSLDAMLRGMMLIESSTYHQYFDREGHMIYDPSKRIPEAENDDPNGPPLEEYTYEPADQPEPANPSLITDSDRKERIRAGEYSEASAFDASKLEKNEIPYMDTVLVRIPAIPGRITRRNRPETGTISIELVTERHYDPTTRQTRRKRVSIGADAERQSFPGMMIPNENYYQYFDHDGNWIVPESETDPEMREALTKGRAELETEEMENNEEEEMEFPADEEDGSMEQEAEERVRQQEHFAFLYNVFQDYLSSVEEQAKKRPYQTMTFYQVRKYNELLQELKEYFANTDLEEYLTLAEMPEDADEAENSMTSFTYGDMNILLVPYSRAVLLLKYGY